MALNLGDLYGTLTLDSKPWDTAITDAKQNLRDLGSKGKVIAGVAGAAIGAALAAGIVKSVDVEAANDKLAASLGLNKKQSERAGKAAGSLYSKAYGQSMGDVSGAVEAVMSSVKGMRTASQPEIEAMTKNVLNMATAFEIDTARAAQVAGQMISTGLAKNGKHATDLLTASLQSVPKAVREDLLDAVDEYGPFMQQVGLSGEKAMGMLVKASEDGMYGIDKTGDAIKEFGIRATDMSKLTGEAYATLGMDQGKMTEALLAGGDKGAAAFQKIVTGLQDVKDPAARSQAALALFGTPLEDLSVTEIPKFLGSLTNTKGGLKDVAGASKDLDKQLNDNAKTTIAELGRTMQTKFVNVLGGAVIPAITKAAKWLNKNLGPAIKSVGRFITNEVMPALKRFGSWFMENKGTIGIIAGIITTLLIPVFLRMAAQATATAIAHVAAWTTMKGQAIKGAAVYVIQSYKMVAAWVRMSAAAVASGIKTATVWTGQIVKQAVKGAVAFAVQVGRVVAGWALMGIKSLLHAAKMAAAWVVAMGPVGWVIAGVIALVALIIANWDKIVKFTKKLWGKVTDWVVGAWKSIKKKTMEILWAIARWVRDKFEWIVATGKRIWFGFRDLLADVWGKIKSTTMRILLSIAEWVRDKFEWVRDTGRRIWNGLLGIIEDAWNGIKNSIRTVWEFIRDKVFGPLKKFITKTIPDAFDTGVAGIKKIWNTLKDIAKAPIRFIVETVFNKGLRPAFNKVMDFVGSDKRLDPISLPKGFKDGGYTGNGPKNAVAGPVHGQEFVVNAEATRQLRAENPGLLESMNKKGSAALGPIAGSPGSFTPIWGPFQASIRRAGELNVNAGAGGAWQIPQAASAWDRLAGLRVRAGAGHPQATTSVGSLDPSILAWATGAGNITFNNQGFAPGMSRPGKLATAIHEIGHVLGLPHDGGASIMQPRIGRYMMPTMRDKSRLSSLYGKGSRDPGEPSFDPLGWVADKVTSAISKLLEKIPGAGAMLDVAVDAGKFLFNMAKDWAIDKVKSFAGGEDPRDKGTSTGTNKFGAKIPTLMDGGGWLHDTGDGAALVAHGRRKPDAFTPYDQFQEIMREVANPTLSGNFNLVVEGHEFPVYLERKAVQATGKAMGAAQSRVSGGGKYVGSFSA